MKRTVMPGIFIWLAVLLLITACGASADNQVFTGLTLQNGTVLVLSESSLLTGQDLVVVHLPDGSTPPPAGSRVTYTIKDEIMESYPPQASAVSFNIEDDDTAIKAGLQTAEKIREHDPDHTIILDVRTPEEYAAGHLPDAVLLPLQEMPAKLPDAAPDTNIIVYCRSGNRSATAADLLRKAGFRIVIDAGGISGYAGETVIPAP